MFRAGGDLLEDDLLKMLVQHQQMTLTVRLVMPVTRSGAQLTGSCQKVQRHTGKVWAGGYKSFPILENSPNSANLVCRHKRFQEVGVNRVIDVSW